MSGRLLLIDLLYSCKVVDQSIILSSFPREQIGVYKRAAFSKSNRDIKLII